MLYMEVPCSMFLLLHFLAGETYVIVALHPQTYTPYQLKRPNFMEGIFAVCDRKFQCVHTYIVPYNAKRPPPM